jgi:hypothetical protein
MQDDAMGKSPRIGRETKPVPAIHPQSNPSKSSQSPQNTAWVLRILLYLTQRHPILFWTGSWLGMVLISWLAISGLTYTNPAPLEEGVEKPKLEVVKPTPPEPQVQPRTPATSFGLLAAVAISCTATSVLLARQLRPVKPAPRRFTRRPSSSTPKPTVKPTPNASIATVAPKPPVAQPENLTPMATPANRSTGWEAAKLADMLDIRQKTSASSQG